MRFLAEFYHVDSCLADRLGLSRLFGVVTRSFLATFMNSAVVVVAGCPAQVGVSIFTYGVNLGFFWL